MPKEIWTINRFDGGQDTASDPRDIGDENQSLSQGINVGDPGLFKMAGSTSNTTQINLDNNISDLAVQIAPGKGFHYWTSDYRWANQKNMYGVVSVNSGYMASPPATQTLHTAECTYDGTGSGITSTAFGTSTKYISYPAGSNDHIVRGMIVGGTHIPANAFIVRILNDEHKFELSVDPLGADTQNLTFHPQQMFGAAQVTNVFGNSIAIDNTGTNVDSLPNNNGYFRPYSGKDTYIGHTAPTDLADSSYPFFDVGGPNNGFSSVTGDSVVVNSDPRTTGSGLTALGYEGFHGESSDSFDNSILLYGNSGAGSNGVMSQIHFNVVPGKRYNFNVRIVQFRDCIPCLAISPLNFTVDTAFSGRGDTSFSTMSGGESTSLRNYMKPHSVTGSVSLYDRGNVRSAFPGWYESFLPHDYVPAPSEGDAYFTMHANEGGANDNWGGAFAINNLEIYEVDSTWNDDTKDSTINVYSTINTGSKGSTYVPGSVSSSNVFSSHQVNAFTGEKIYNVTDGSWSYIKSNTEKTITHCASIKITNVKDAGTDWDRSDRYYGSGYGQGPNGTGANNNFVRLDTNETRTNYPNNTVFVPGQRVYIENCSTGHGTVTVGDGLYNIVDTGWTGNDSTSTFFFVLDINSGGAGVSFAVEGLATGTLIGGHDNGWQAQDIYRIGDETDNQLTSTYALINDEDSGGQYMWWKEHPTRPWDTSGGRVDMGSDYPTAPDYYTVNGNIRMSDSNMFESTVSWLGYISDRKFVGTKHEQQSVSLEWADEWAAVRPPEYGVFAGTTNSAYEGMRGLSDKWPEKTFTIKNIETYDSDFVRTDANDTFTGVGNANFHGALTTDEQLYVITLSGTLDTEVLFEGQKIRLEVGSGGFDGSHIILATIDSGGSDDYIIFKYNDGISDLGAGTYADKLIVDLEYVPQKSSVPAIYMSIQSSENSDSTKPGNWNDFVRYYTTWIYKGGSEGQESLPVMMDNRVKDTSGLEPLREYDGLSGPGVNSDRGVRKRFKIYAVPGHRFYKDAGGGYGTTPYGRLNPRITGARVYYRKVDVATSTDGTTTATESGPLYLLGEADFREGKGVRKNPTTSQWHGWKDWTYEGKWRKSDTYVGNLNAAANDSRSMHDVYFLTDPGNTYVESDGWLEYNSPPTDFTYSDMAKYTDDEIATMCSWKTSCVLKSRVFVGNVTYYSKNPDGTGYSVKNRVSDGMMVSLKGKPDLFPLSGLEMISSEYEDEITSLETYADRVLQFRKNSMHILNIQNDIIMTEASYKYKGCANTYATCQTDFGVVWAGKNGVFLYNGEEVLNLFDRKGLKIFSEDAWESFYTKYTSVGYDPVSRKILVSRSVEPLHDEMWRSLSIPQQNYLAPATNSDSLPTKFNFDDNLDMIHNNGFEALLGVPAFDSNTTTANHGTLKNSTAAQSSVAIKMETIPGKAYQATVDLVAHTTDAKMSISSSKQYSSACSVNLATNGTDIQTPEFIAKDRYSYLILQLDSSTINQYIRIQNLAFKSNNPANSGDCYMFDVVMNAWTYHPDFLLDNYARGDFVNDVDGELFYMQDAVSDGHDFPKVNLKEPGDNHTLDYQTKDIDFGASGVRKKVHRIYITYKASAANLPTLTYFVNGESSAKNVTALSNWNASGSDWKTAVFKPAVSSEANNIYSIKLRLNGSSIDQTFSVNDISISYRVKQIK
tara:strand:- start:3458 stop:8494 length:5037 start_codon:yes stop_codon:yes gene_type:complete